MATLKELERVKGWKRPYLLTVHLVDIELDLVDLTPAELLNEAEWVQWQLNNDEFGESVTSPERAALTRYINRLRALGIEPEMPPDPEDDPRLNEAAEDTNQQVNPEIVTAEEEPEKPQMWYVNARFSNGSVTTLYVGTKEACLAWVERSRQKWMAHYGNDLPSGLYEVEDYPLKPDSVVLRLPVDTVQQVNPATAEEEDVCASCGFCVGGVCPHYDPPDRDCSLVCDDFLSWEGKDTAQQVNPETVTAEDEADKEMPWEGLSREDYFANTVNVDPCDECKHDLDPDDLFCMACRHNPENRLVGKNAGSAAPIRSPAEAKNRHNDENAQALLSIGWAVEVQDRLGGFIPVTDDPLSLSDALEVARSYAHACARETQCVRVLPAPLVPAGVGVTGPPGIASASFPPCPWEEDLPF